MGMQPPNDIVHYREVLGNHLPLLREQYQVQSLGLFGSRVRHDEHATSDLDVLVELKEVPGLLKFIELENYLSDLLGVKVDLVMRDALKPVISRHILEEVIPV